MELHILENQLAELAALCEHLVRILEEEHRALRSWNVEEVYGLAQDKELLLAAIEMADQSFKEGLEQLTTQYACTITELLSRDEAFGLCELRARIEKCNLKIRKQGKVNRLAAEHAVKFLHRIQGNLDESNPLSYAPSYTAYGGSRFHHVV